MSDNEMVKLTRNVMSTVWSKTGGWHESCRFD